MTTGTTYDCSAGTYSPQIRFTNSTGMTLNLNDPGINVTGGSGVMITAAGGNTADIIINAAQFGTIDTGSDGIRADNTGSGDTIVTMGAGSINQTLSAVGFGLAATNSGSGSATATLNGGSILTRIGLGVGVYARHTGTGAATATMTGGSVQTSNTASTGVRADVAAGSSADATVNFSGGSITTQGSSAYGLFSYNLGSGAAIVQMSGGVIATGGNNASGVYANSATGSYNVAITGGAITAGSGNAAGVHTSAAGGGVLTIGAGATIDGGASGVAIRDGDADRDNVDEIGGDAVITTAGMLNGKVLLGGGTDSLTITGGAINGDITGDGPDTVAFNLGTGSFTYGAPYTMSGLSSITMVSGSARIDSAVAGGTSVTVAGGTLTLTGANTYSGGTTISAGALQIGAGGATGSIAGNVLNNGTLIFNRSDTATFSGLISGSGVVEQLGAGTTVLTSVNAYSGGTAINAGALRISQDANLGALAGGVQFDGGTLQNTAAFTSARNITLNAGGGAFLTDAELTLSGVVSGGGALTKLGSATLILTGANTYSGGTTIQGGTLQVGGGGASGSLTGDVANSGVLAFNRSDAVSFAGVISGTGAVNQLGAGTTTLSAANSYSGGTTIAAGTLRGSATSFGSGAIVNNAALIIDQATDAGFANVINGTGSFTKTGAGRLNYTGVAGLTGPTTVAVGALAVNGSLANSAVEVMSGASLGGNGTVGSTIIRTGASVAPGNSIGTLHVNGNFVQEAGSTYQVELDPNSNNSDLIVVTGTATLDAGAGLNVSKATAGDYRVGALYRVLSADGGLTGTYTLSGQAGQLSAFLALQASYDANNAYLKVVQTGDPGAAADTPNGRAVAGGLPVGPVNDAVLNAPTLEDARNLLDQLTGDGHAAAKGVLVNDSRLVRDLAVDRVRDILCGQGAPAKTDEDACLNDSGRVALWGQAFGSWGQTDGQAGVGNIQRSTGGFLVGLDAPAAALGRVGAFAGYSHTELRLHARTGEAGVDSYHLGVYGGRQAGPLGLRYGAAYSWHEVATARQVVLPNLYNHLRADYDAGAAQVFAELGRRLDFGRISIEPFLNVAFVSVKTDGFNEAGGVAALSARSDDERNGFTTLGARPSTSLQVGSVKAVLRGMVGWRHASGDVTPTQAVAFAGGSDFIVQGAAIARDAGLVELGADMRLGASGTLGLTYAGQYGDRSVDQSLRGRLTYRF